jgi:hypothetical protein
VAIVSPWMEIETAPAALVAAAVFFLVAIWPFWPAFTGPCPVNRPLCPFARPTLELVMLLALAAPFALVAWSVGGHRFHVDGLVRAGLGIAILALGTRILSGTLDSAGRWLMLAAMLACVGPVALHYAATEAMNEGWPRVLELSPLVGTGGMAVDGWQRGNGWRTFADMGLWPAVGAIEIGAAVLVVWRSKRTAHSS